MVSMIALKLTMLAHQEQRDTSFCVESRKFVTGGGSRDPTSSPRVRILRTVSTETELREVQQLSLKPGEPASPDVVPLPICGSRES
jgi:hypothetical protein